MKNLFLKCTVSILSAAFFVMMPKAHAFEPPLRFLVSTDCTATTFSQTVVHIHTKGLGRPDVSSVFESGFIKFTTAAGLVTSYRFGPNDVLYYALGYDEVTDEFPQPGSVPQAFPPMELSFAVSIPQQQLKFSFDYRGPNAANEYIPPTEPLNFGSLRKAFARSDRRPADISGLAGYQGIDLDGKPKYTINLRELLCMTRNELLAVPVYRQQ